MYDAVFWGFSLNIDGKLRRASDIEKWNSSEKLSVFQFVFQSRDM